MRKKVLPRFELGLPDSESGVLTVTPQDRWKYLYCASISIIDGPWVSFLTDALVFPAVEESIRKQNTHRGARTHDHQVKSLTLYRLS